MIHVAALLSESIATCGITVVAVPEDGGIAVPGIFPAAIVWRDAPRRRVPNFQTNRTNCDGDHCSKA